MSANILLIECERSSVDAVRAALTGRDHRLETAGDLNTAVDVCAHFEPKIVIITSSLPGVTVSDAITQLRARAGLRVTPFLILMSGFDAEDSKAEAETHGAQDILARPFTPDEVNQTIEEMLSAASEILTTQAVPRETLDALRNAGGTDGKSFSSDDLFADILSDVEDASEEKTASIPETSKSETRGVNVDRALADVLGTPKEERKSSISNTEIPSGIQSGPYGRAGSITESMGDV